MPNEPQADSFVKEPASEGSQANLEPSPPAAAMLNLRARLAQGSALLFVGYAKYKFVLIVLLKILPIIVSVYYYSLFFGWPYAVLFVALLAIHESGHYVVMRRFGIDAGFPMFIPGLGAMIFTRSMGNLSRFQQAIIGYAGPFVGTVGAIAFAGHGYWAHSSLWLAAAYTGFFLNAFNLLPLPPLDGSHIVALVSDRLWLLGLVLFAALCYFLPALRNPLVMLIIILAIPRVFTAWAKRSQPTPRTSSLATRLIFAGLYFGLIGVDLAGMLITHVD